MSFKLTRWFNPDEKPVRIGEYNASMIKDKTVRRWWNGECWSYPYSAAVTEHAKRNLRKLKDPERNQNGIFWRGVLK